MREFGLIGYPLEHSFSARYFGQKFAAENISDAVYKLFPLQNISELPEFLAINTDLQGFNITIPHKIVILPFLSELSAEAAQAGAVNCVKIKRTDSGYYLKGFNTDVYGFRESLKPRLKPHHTSALILGTGGAAKAAAMVLRQLGISYSFVSRNPELKNTLIYHNLTADVLTEHTIIINTTPAGMYPKVDLFPEIPYNLLTDKHLLFDLIYNPAETLFLRKGKLAGAETLNGLQMLELQAEKSWEIWNSSDFTV